MYSHAVLLSTSPPTEIVPVQQISIHRNTEGTATHSTHSIQSEKIRESGIDLPIHTVDGIQIGTAKPNPKTKKDKQTKKNAVMYNLHVFRISLTVMVSFCSGLCTKKINIPTVVITLPKKQAK